MKVVLWEKITSWESLRMSISKFPGHMQSTKLNFSVTVYTLGLKAKMFGNLRLGWVKVLVGTAHTPHVWSLCVLRHPCSPNMLVSVQMSLKMYFDVLFCRRSWLSIIYKLRMLNFTSIFWALVHLRSYPSRGLVKWIVLLWMGPLVKKCFLHSWKQALTSWSKWSSCTWWKVQAKSTSDQSCECDMNIWNSYIHIIVSHIHITRSPSTGI